MKRFSEKKLYETTIKHLLNTRFYKGEKPYVFAYYTYENKVYNFVFVPECEKDKAPNYIGVKCRINIMRNQHLDDYAETYARNCKLFDKCENISNG